MLKQIDRRRKCFLWFPIRFTTYTIYQDNEGYVLIIEEGLISKRTNKIRLYRVADVTYNRSIGNFLCGVSNMTITSSDPSSIGTRSNYSHVTLEKMRRGREFCDLIERYANKERSKRNIQYKEVNVI